MNIGVKYLLSNDPSGYSEAARNFVMALFVNGVNCTVETIKQMPENSDYGICGQIVDYLKNKDIYYQIKIIHLTPDLIPQYKEKGVYTISHLFWECNKLPNEWIAPLNECDELWVASPQMAEMIKSSGVKTLCKWFSQPILTTPAAKIVPFYTIHPKNFTFYSIFQWIDRKNPKGLLTAYWKEFEGNDNVTLLIKTYRIIYIEEEIDLIKADITNWKAELKLKHYPKIFLVSRLLHSNELPSLHCYGDCFIQPSSGEGWSRPTMEAMIHSKPVISGSNGGITDIIPKSLYYKVSTTPQKVTEVSWIPWYKGYMTWKKLDEASLREQMRFVYEHQQESCKIGEQAKEYVMENFNSCIIGQQMKNRIEEIAKFL